MNIPLDDITDFHKRRTRCHIDCLNYFAGLLGYHFPEHDNDKNIEPYLTGYAYHNYAAYHDGCAMPPQWLDAFESVRAEHHRMQPHHTEHYRSMAEIPHARLIEMICDWHSANFEQTNITHENDFADVAQFFELKMSGLDWTPAQRKLILDTIKLIADRADPEIVRGLWDKLTD
jgi:hypothetical protein